MHIAARTGAARHQARVGQIQKRLVVGILRRDPRRSQRAQHDCHQDRQGQHGQLAARKIAPQHPDVVGLPRFARIGLLRGATAHLRPPRRMRGASMEYRISTTMLITMNMNTTSSREPTTTVWSSVRIESITSLPVPGQEKIVSVTTANAIMVPNSTPSTVTSGTMIVGSTWRSMTRSADPPLARANLTYQHRIPSGTPQPTSPTIGANQNRTKLDAGSSRCRQKS